MKVGLSLPQAPHDGEAGTWVELARLVDAAEAGLADSLWVCDHFLDRTADRETGYHEPFTLLAAVAARTRRIGLGTLVAAGPFRSPGLLAKEAATVDFVADGRFVLGLGTGWSEPEFRAFGYPFDHLVSRLEELLVVLGPLLAGDRVSSDGRWTRLDDAVILPRPSGRIPIVVAAEGPRMLGLAARHADGWQTAWYGLPDASFRAVRERFQQACEAEGRTRPVEVLVGVEVGDDGTPDPHLPLDAAAIADGLNAWKAEGVDHVQLGVWPATLDRVTVALDAIRRFHGPK